MRSLCLASLMLLVSATPSRACECFGPAICQRIESTPVVFLGETIFGGLNRDQDAWRPTATSARLRIIERYRGIPEDVGEVEISLSFWGGWCEAMPYRLGERTLVFLHRDKNGTLRDGPCTASRIVDEDSDDLDLVRRYFAGNAKTAIRGIVTVNDDSRSSGSRVEDALIVAERGGIR